MEKKELSEIAKLKLQNISLSLQILQLQAQLFMADKEKILQDEFSRLGCLPDEWQLDERDGTLIKLEQP